MTLFYGQNSIKSSLKSSAILHFRDSKLKNFRYKASHLQRSTRASKLQLQPSPLTTKSFLRPNSFDIKTVGVKMLCFFGAFYRQNSIKSTLKSSAILHFRNSKLKNFPYKASHLQRSTRASKLQFQPPQPKRTSYGPGTTFICSRFLLFFIKLQLSSNVCKFEKSY